MGTWTTYGERVGGAGGGGGGGVTWAPHGHWPTEVFVMA